LIIDRKNANIPEISYDLDGDGVVSQRDFFFSQLYDKNKKLKLSPTEREACLQAIKVDKID